MDLILAVLSFIVANLLLFYGLRADTFQFLQFLLVGLLGVLILLKILQLRREKAGPEARGARKPGDTAPVAPPPSRESAAEASVVQFLARMQEKGRLVDYLMDDIAPYSNEQIGVVARVVHQGCREVLRSAFDIEPVHAGQERDAVVLSGDFDAAAYRLVGKVPDHPPYKGTVLHRGWKAARISLPRVTEAACETAAGKIIAPAEVEVG